MSTTAATRSRTTPVTVHPGRARVLSAAAATAAAMAVWVIAVPALGIHLVVRFGDGNPQTVGPGLVAGAALAASLCGWGLLALLERRTRHARAIWTAAAIAITAASLALPLSVATAAAAGTALAAMHLAVAAVAIPALRRTAAPRAGS